MRVMEGERKKRERREEKSKRERLYRRVGTWGGNESFLRAGGWRGASSRNFFSVFGVFLIPIFKWIYFLVSIQTFFRLSGAKYPNKSGAPNGKIPLIPRRKEQIRQITAVQSGQCLPLTRSMVPAELFSFPRCHTESTAAAVLGELDSALASPPASPVLSRHRRQFYCSRSNWSVCLLGLFPFARFY